MNLIGWIMRRNSLIIRRSESMFCLSIIALRQVTNRRTSCRIRIINLIGIGKTNGHLVV